MLLPSMAYESSWNKKFEGWLDLENRLLIISSVEKVNHFFKIVEKILSPIRDGGLGASRVLRQVSGGLKSILKETLINALPPGVFITFRRATGLPAFKYVMII